LFLDVDGPLIPFGVPAWEGQSGRRTSAHAYQPWETCSNPLLARLNPEHGASLLALGCDLMWASSWMAEANQEIARGSGCLSCP
jgi:hypothetical protein